MNYGFKMPKRVNIMARSSSITNSFINGILPQIRPSEAEIIEVLDFFNQKKENVRCVYCGDKMTEWDHLNPIIRNKKETGYITEIDNLVPACSKCNQSKGNKNWKVWMLSDASLSPKSKKIPDLNDRVKKLEEFEKRGNLIAYNFKEIVGDELWAEYWGKYKIIIDAMEDSMDLMNSIRKKINDEICSSCKKMKEDDLPIEVDVSKINNKENLSKNDVLTMINSSIEINIDKEELTFSNINKSTKAWAFDISSTKISNGRYLALNDSRYEQIYLFHMDVKFINENMNNFKYNNKKDAYLFKKKPNESLIINGIDFNQCLVKIIAVE